VTPRWALTLRISEGNQDSSTTNSAPLTSADRSWLRPTSKEKGRMLSKTSDAVRPNHSTSARARPAKSARAMSTPLGAPVEPEVNRQHPRLEWVGVGVPETDALEPTGWGVSLVCGRHASFPLGSHASSAF